MKADLKQSCNTVECIRLELRLVEMVAKPFDRFCCSEYLTYDKNLLAN